MEFALFCLKWIEIAFICVHLFTSIFFKLERGVVHQIITSVIVTLCYGIEAVLRIIAGDPSFIASIVVLVIWGLILFTSIIRLRRVNKLKKKFQEEREKTRRDQP